MNDILAIDVRAACTPRRDGKGQWTYGFTSELLRRAERLRLLTDSPLPDAWRAMGAIEERIEGSGLGWHLKVASWLRKHQPRFYVSPTSYIVPAIASRSVRCIPVVHDLIAFRNEPHDRKATMVERLTLGCAVSRAAHVLTVSESTKYDLLTRYPQISPDRVTTVFAGPMQETVQSNKSNGRTILCIATLSPRKNQARLIQAYASLPSDFRSQYSLMLVGARGWSDSNIHSLLKQTPGAVWYDYANSEDYADLMHNCAIFALPSLYEGFGMQILDALQRGIPILTSDRGSLKEVAGDAALTVDPESVSAIAAGLEKLLRDDNLRQDLRKKGPMQAAHFSWKRTVDLFLGAL